MRAACAMTGCCSISTRRAGVAEAAACGCHYRRSGERRRSGQGVCDDEQADAEQAARHNAHHQRLRSAAGRSLSCAPAAEYHAGCGISCPLGVAPSWVVSEAHLFAHILPCAPSHLCNWVRTARAIPNALQAMRSGLLGEAADGSKPPTPPVGLGLPITALERSHTIGPSALPVL